MNFEIRELKPEDVDAFRQAISSGFGHDADLDDEQGGERFRAMFDRERMLPVFAGDEIMGTGGDFALTLTVPGGAQVPMSGLTIITVQPTHTRQGMLTAMMRKHIDAARDRGEPLGGLWASEVPIYGRYGYGPAVRMRGIKYDARFAGRGRSEEGVMVRLAPAEEAEVLLPPLFAAVQGGRPGMFQRSADWWKWRLFFDPEKHREGQSALRHAIAEVDGEPVGYMTYRQKASWDQLAEGELRIREVIATTDAGYRALWHYATNVDLFPIVKCWNIAADDPLQLLLHDGRAVTTTNMSDSLWIRLVDVADALRRRTYAGSGTITIAVADAFADWNAGTYRITVENGVATVDKVVTEADLAMDVSTLGALYLGGRDAMGLARVGRIEGSVEAVGKLDALFRISVAPWCAEVF
ncbi:MAG: GNAT family N-acetyltransferase [Acidimicrobiia bacterium]|nr:GNAT family N-acetyltransferase [Acidimicrobiia bacterium]